MMDCLPTAHRAFIIDRARIVTPQELRHIVTSPHNVGRVGEQVCEEGTRLAFTSINCKVPPPITSLSAHARASSRDQGKMPRLNLFVPSYDLCGKLRVGGGLQGGLGAGCM